MTHRPAWLELEYSKLRQLLEYGKIQFDAVLGITLAHVMVNKNTAT